MNPELINLIAGFTLNLIEEFRHRKDTPTEDEIAARFELHYKAALVDNQRLIDETK
jgi:hypothetical protein